jgi:hypothetical protein
MRRTPPTSFVRSGSLWVPGAKRRAWMPYDVPEYKFWFTPRDGTTDAGGGAVSAWADVRARGTRYATSQATGSARPALATGINSRASLSFLKANSKELTNTTNDPVASGATRYVLAVVQSLDSVGGTVFQFRLNSTGGRVWCLQLASPDPNFYYFTDAVSNNIIDTGAAPTITVPTIAEWELTLGASLVVRLNGVTRTTSGSVNATADTGTTGFHIGGRAPASQFWNGHIADIFCASPIPSLADRARLRNYFSVANGGIL